MSHPTAHCHSCSSVTDAKESFYSECSGINCTNSKWAHNLSLANILFFSSLWFWSFMIQWSHNFPHAMAAQMSWSAQLWSHMDHYFPCKNLVCKLWADKLLVIVKGALVSLTLKYLLRCSGGDELKTSFAAIYLLSDENHTLILQN